MNKYLILSDIDYEYELRNKIIITKIKTIPDNFKFDLILSKYIELYNKDQLNNFPNSYYVYIHNSLNSYNIKYEFNKNKDKFKIKSMTDIYKLLYDIINNG
jgi:hypothetical protein